MKKYVAEMVGTMVLVLMGCGSAVFAGTAQPFAAVGTLGVAFAFGLAVLAMVYTIGKISGCHINPAITLGMLISKKISGKDAGMYMDQYQRQTDSDTGKLSVCPFRCGT